MKALDRYVIESILSDDDEISSKKIDKVMTEDDFNQMKKSNKFVIYVDVCEYYDLVDRYIVEAGDKTIGAPYGQSEYDDDSLSGQLLDSFIGRDMDADAPGSRLVKELNKRLGKSIIDLSKAKRPLVFSKFDIFDRLDYRPEKTIDATL